MLAGVLGSNITNPGHWHKSFKVGLGLDLSWGTQVTLKAIPPKGHTVNPGEMAKAKAIMFSRINSSGFLDASVVQQGSDEIVVSVPHENAEQVANLVGTTAQLSFRQVLLAAPNYVPSSTTPTPSATPSTSASPKSSASPSKSSTPKTSSSPKPSASTSGGTGQAAGASAVGATSTPSPSASASPSATVSTSPSPKASPSASSKSVLATTADGAGNASALNAQTTKDFNILNCADKNWQSQVYGSNPNGWDRTTQQSVGCYNDNGVQYKYAMQTPVILGTDLTAVNAVVNTSGSGWIVDFNVKSGPAAKLGNLTETLATQYYPTASTNEDNFYLCQLAVVLDGQIQSSPQVQGQITTSGEINGGSAGGFSENQATSLANILKYGQLPLSFQTLDSSNISPQLGSASLSAGIIAGLVGLILVVVYSFIYYRGLALVSVSSLAIAACITYLAVVLLSAHESFNLTLAGVAGLIVSIGITADSFVVYFERLRDEVREGRSLRAAVERGWVRARRTILVSDTVSFLAALLLYIIAVGDVRGFAYTLGLTTLVDIVVVFLFTKPMITLLARTKFYGQGHKLSGLDPSRLGSRAPWRGGRRPVARPATGTAGTGAQATQATPKEA
jgi:preprotein translocase subunit SecD